MHYLQSIVSVLSVLALVATPTAAIPEGLEIEYLTPEVTCTRKTVKGDKIDVHYAGTLQDGGKEFDSSYSRGTPLSFQVGSGRVIKGWDEGLLDMCIGEKRRLTIPPALGYGAQSVGPIPANSVLVFETELVGIKGVKKDEL
ncbi:FK506-binding protein 2 [Exophiala mesophila]|uniref:peptidylprolyl isomerase n=1 Tax=Exophiala mesophila TaxID=212818 RepID=A0A438N8X5_EXOME|nr:FK506-binding protein 2 [Exophiala mesophila]